MILDLPGKNHDLSGHDAAAWTTFVVKQVMTPSIQGSTFSGVVPWFVDTTTIEDPPKGAVPIEWTAFPKQQPGLHHEVDGARQAQDEYCEWGITRDGDRLNSVTFTTETPDYHRFLYETARNVLVALYHEYVSPDVQEADLGDGIKYNPNNSWNNGARAPGRLLHMAQTNNNLFAAAALAARATWPAADQSASGGLVPVVSEQELTNCLDFGNPRRHSDPHIGAQVNEQVRSGHRVALSNPLGLYIGRILLSDFETPDGSPIGDWFRYDDTRGVDGFRTRVTFSAPEHSNVGFSDLRVNGDRVTSGGQIAEKIKVHLGAWTLPTDDPIPEAFVCPLRREPDKPALTPHMLR